MCSETTPAIRAAIQIAHFRPEEILICATVEIDVFILDTVNKLVHFENEGYSFFLLFVSMSTW